jgi:hypothetical protein
MSGACAWAGWTQITERNNTALRERLFHAFPKLNLIGMFASSEPYKLLPLAFAILVFGWTGGNN